MSWVIRCGTMRGAGSYWCRVPDSQRGEWGHQVANAVRYETWQQACRALGNLSDSFAARLVRVGERWRPRCGDRVRVLVDDQKGRVGFVMRDVDPNRIFISIPSLDYVTVGPYTPNDLLLERAAERAPSQQTSNTTETK